MCWMLLLLTDIVFLRDTCISSTHLIGLLGTNWA
jgi:hypothetical protein